MTENAEPTDIQDSTPGSSGPERASGDMGVSSERAGPAGPDHATDGLKDTSAATDDLPRDELPPEQRPDVEEHNPDGLEPKAGYPSLDPRSGS